MACDAATLINTAVSNGYLKLSERDLLACILAAACAGGTGGGGSVTCGAGPPAVAPAGGCGLYINTNDGTLFEYYSGAWH